MTTSAKPTMPALPTGIRASDLKFPSYKSRDRVLTRFELIHTSGFGWVIATLLISKSRRSVGGDRTYAVRVETGEACRVGMGPHVTARVQVYVRASRAKALARFTEMLAAGEAQAHAIRDRISTRRMRSALRGGF